LTETVVVDGFFLPDESELKDENAISVLENVSSKLNDIPAMNIHLKSETENQQINYNRVQSVKNYLIRNGINVGRIDEDVSSLEENAQTEI